MDKKLYKCFRCGKLYETDEAAHNCHKAPVQLVVVKDTGKKPRFLGN